MPWRETRDPYRIWLSEIILQQTQVNQGLPYYNAFVNSFPTVYDLANANEDQVLKLWQGLGYYSRARNLHHSAKVIVKDHQGTFPGTYSELLKLKGIGDYTASAIASICYDEQTAVVDGNVYRFLSRFFGIDTPINSSQGIKEFKAMAQHLLPEKHIGEHNQAIMEFGARQCKPKSPNCNLCPFQNKCVALKEMKIEDWPVKINKTKIKKRYFNYLVLISDDQQTVLEQRIGKGIWQNLYQFPLVETEALLSIKAFTNLRDVKSLLNDAHFEFSLFNEKPIVHKLSHQHLYTQFWIINVEKLPIEGIALSEIKSLAVPTLISNFIDRLSLS